MKQQRVRKPVRVTDKRRAERDNTPQERPEVREDVWERWFKER